MFPQPLFLDRVVVMVPGKPTYDRFGDLVPGKPTRKVLDVPCSLAQTQTVEKEGAEWVHRTVNDYLLISQRGHNLVEITSDSTVFVGDDEYQVQGTPSHFRTPLIHSEIRLKRVEG